VTAPRKKKKTVARRRKKAAGKATKKATKKRPTRTRGPAINWTEIQLDYVTNPGVSLRQLAEKWGIHRVTVQKKAAREGWNDEREEFMRELVLEARQRTAALCADHAATHFAELLVSLRDIRSEVMGTFLNRIRAAAGAEDGLEVDEREVTKTEVLKDGSRVQSRARKRVAPAAGHFAEVVLNTEARLLSGILKIDGLGGGSSGDEVVSIE